MKGSSAEDQKMELRRAKLSHHNWASSGRLLDYDMFREFMKDDEECGEQFCELMKGKGFAVQNEPGCRPTTNLTRKALAEATPHVRMVLQKLEKGQPVHPKSLLYYRRYLLGVLMISHELKGKDAVRFQVNDWIHRSKTATQPSEWICPSGIKFNEEEAQLFCGYFTKIRPLLLENQSSTAQDDGCFLLSENGTPIANPSRELKIFVGEELVDPGEG